MKKFIDVSKKTSKHKIRVNITVDKDTLDKAKTKLNLFGGKLSTLFNAYLKDFVESMDKKGDENMRQLNDELRILRERVEKLEKEEEKEGKLKSKKEL
jgi:hypothetical protein